MSLPSTVTSRAEGNSFVANTGMSLTGVTGFGIRTGFYLTNSGNYPIRTELLYSEAPVLGIFDFPSGKEFDILAGSTKFIPFEMTFSQDNISGPAVGATGPDVNGTWVSSFNLSTRSLQNAQPDADGNIIVGITGQVTGFGGGTGPFTTTIPAHPSGFLITTDYGTNGKPQQVLRWQHPSSGYYFQRYKIEYAGNIEDSSVATGVWTGLFDFDINRTLTTQGGDLEAGEFQYYKYATNTGIAQLHTRGTSDNPRTPYGEYTVSDLDFNANYYYRIKSQYIDRDSSIYYESPYVYGYPVDNFNVEITNADINGGLLSGSTTLSATTDPSTVIANDSNSPSALKIFFDDRQANINLKTEFDNTLTNIGASVNNFDPTHADYSYSGVHFIVAENYRVGSTKTTNAGITSGAQLKYGSTEIKSNLILHKNSTVAGLGGNGGNGGFTEIKLSDGTPRPQHHSGKIQFDKTETINSDAGGDGSAAIHINDTAISELKIKKHFTARIYGGGGGGGGGDPFFFPKAFAFSENPTYNLSSPGIDRLVYDRVSVNDGVISDHKDRTIKITIPNRSSSDNPGLINLKVEDFFGKHYGGLGGGGQGFDLSEGGYSKDQGSSYIFAKNQGSFEGAGLGTDANFDTHVSIGGRGGVFGEDGETPLDVNANLIYRRATDSEPAAGGKAGEAIKIIDGNTNYSTFDDLVQYQDGKIPNSTNYPDLVAWFTTEDTSSTYFDTTAAGSYSEINQWKAKNDTSMYIQFYNNNGNGTTTPDRNYRPILVTSSTPNATAYYSSFNNKDTVFFGSNSSLKAGGGELFNVVRSGRIENSMQGFEIVYFLYPSVTSLDGNEASQHSTWYTPDSRVSDRGKVGLWRVNKRPPRYDAAIRSRPLHQWSAKQNQLNQSTRRETAIPAFYYQVGTSASARTYENTGLPQGYGVNFFDFTGSKDPLRAWMYSISSYRIGSYIYYNIYNDLELVCTKRFRNVNTYDWLTKPRIGFVRDKNYNDQSFYYGSISDIAIFKGPLSEKERENLLGHFSNKKLKVQSSANKNDANDRNQLKNKTNFAGFNIGPSW